MVQEKEPGFTAARGRAITPRRSCQTVPAEVVSKSRPQGALAQRGRESNTILFSILVRRPFFLTANSDQEVR